MEQAKTILIGAETYPPDINGAAQFGHHARRPLCTRGRCQPHPSPSYTEVEGGIVWSTVCARTLPTHETNRVCPPWRSGPRLLILDEVRPTWCT